LQEIARDVDTNGEYRPIGELYDFPVLVKTGTDEKDGREIKLNRFFIEGEYKYSFNNGQIAMSDHKAAAMNFLNALERIPKLIDQYRAQNARLERDIPTLQDVANCSWKKEGELKVLKGELAALERKIQLTLVPNHEIPPDTGKTKQLGATDEKGARGIPEEQKNRKPTLVHL
jgi:hypothetical protein